MNITDYNWNLGNEFMVQKDDIHEAITRKEYFFDWLCSLKGWYHDSQKGQVAIINSHVIYDSYRDEYPETPQQAPIRSYDEWLFMTSMAERMELFSQFAADSNLDWENVNHEPEDDYDLAAEAWADLRRSCGV